MDGINTSDILTFDELLEDEYYKSEFEKRLQQELDIKNSHSDVKGGKIMDPVQNTQNGETTADNAAPAQVKSTSSAEPTKPGITSADNPIAENTNAKKTKEETPADAEPAKEMTAQEFELYNETLRRVSKTAKTDLSTRYNAFEDAEVKSLIKSQILAGVKPSIKGIAAGVVTRLTPKLESRTETKTKEPESTNQSGEVALLKAELALVKAGIVSQRLEAAKKLFIAEGGDPEKAAEFVSRYPEWKASISGGITFSQAPPVTGKTSPNPISAPVYNDFEKKVAAMRKKAGLV